jgi:ABC-2 type transport system permease protein
LLAALAGPGLVAPDLTNNALTLYLSRPLSRFDYALARLMVIGALLSLVTWVPGLILFGIQSGMAGWGWFAGHWRIGAGLVGGLGLAILVISLVALASSAYVRWRVVAGALVLAFYFVLAGAARIVREVMSSDWAYLLDPGNCVYRVSCFLLGEEMPEGPGVFACAASLTVIVLLLAWILERKLRPVEVIS